nr:unnamed protein product [Digitaria exilis]
MRGGVSTIDPPRAPRVWFNGDIYINLESEIRRASRLRCKRCGLRGAALGCFDKDCRKTFHVPCALQITECHWDNEGNVLCPEHVPKRLLCDKLSTHTEENGDSSSLCQSQCSDKEENFDDHDREIQQTNQLSTSNASSLPQSQCSQKGRKGTSTSGSRDDQQIDPLDNRSSSLPLDEHDDEEIYKNHERDDQWKHKRKTSNLSSLPHSCHPDEEGISNAHQRKERAYQPHISTCPSDQLVLLGLSLNASEKDFLQEFAYWTNAILTKQWAKNVTHVIVGKGAGSSWSRSFEVLMGILLGKWVVHFEWIADCTLETNPLPEASYEVACSMDSLRTIDGPKKGRIRATKGVSNLFSGLRFCLSAYMNPDNRNRVRDLIAAAEGRVLEGGDLELLLKDSDGSLVKPYFVYDVDAPKEAVALSTLREELAEVRKHAAAGAQVICYLRVLDAVAAYDAEILNAKKGHSTP